MNRKEIKKEAKNYSEGWGYGVSDDELNAFEQGAIWAYNRALEDAVKVGEGDPYIYVFDIEKLKIRD